MASARLTAQPTHHGARRQLAIATATVCQKAASKPAKTQRNKNQTKIQSTKQITTQQDS